MMAFFGRGAASGGVLPPAWNPQAPTVRQQDPARGSAVQQMTGTSSPLPVINHLISLNTTGVEDIFSCCYIMTLKSFMTNESNAKHFVRKQ